MLASMHDTSLHAYACTRALLSFKTVLALYIYLYTHTYTHTQMYIHTQTSIRTHEHMHTWTHVNVHTITHTWTHTHMCTTVASAWQLHEHKAQPVCRNHIYRKIRKHALGHAHPQGNSTLVTPRREKERERTRTYHSPQTCYLHMVTWSGVP
jgi:hypothetical protein